MKDIFLTSEGDIELSTLDISLVAKPSDIAQSVRIILTTRLSEFSLEPELGLSYDNLLGKRFNKDYLRQDITDAILEQEERIISVDEVLIIKGNGRHLDIAVKMTANNTQIEVGVELNA